jgi:phosphoesterase RecJ-like protein
MTSPNPLPLQNKAAVLSLCGEPSDGAAAALIQGLVDDAGSVVIIGHERPDGDCIGSEIALCSILRGLGKRSEIVNADATPVRYAFLDPDAMIRQHRPGVPFQADLVFVLDSTDLKRIGTITRDDLGGARIVNIDHHPGNPLFGDVNFVDTRAAAAAELVWRLASERRWSVPPLAREALYTGLVTDTGHFAYSNTTARVLRMAAELRELGVDGEAVWRAIYLNKTRAELDLETRARASLECRAGGKICLIALRHTDFIATGTTPQNAEEFSGIPRMLAGVELAVFFYEIKGGAATKVSMRSTRDIDAGALARSFGGGGHRQAAGCSFDLPLDAAKAVFLPAAERALVSV